MFNKGDVVWVKCDHHGRPSCSEFFQHLNGKIEFVTLTDAGTYRYSVYINLYGGNWIVTAVEDESLLCPKHLH